MDAQGSDVRWKQRFDNLQRAYQRLRWIDMLEERNLMAHTYDDTRARKAVDQIQERYLSGLQQLHDLLATKRQEAP
jgi:uncharacterized protein with HEPN domain